MSGQADVQAAVSNLVLALTPVDEQYAEIHYHLTDGQELTIAASLMDTEMHFRGMIEELEGTNPGEFTIDRSSELDAEYIALSAFGATIRFRVRPCLAPTCEKALSDYWL